ncbi:proteinase-activated receptor 1-like [Rana temporaria]|uniref:proteinase-activated receptor 1-like n=1 Tax=Rana temporaria TaxID=8407 RepID=UPI001AACE7F4|nr:proteinase-activated receptor 1-like [Rana temporaria]
MQDINTSVRHWSVTRLVPSFYTVVFLVALPLNIMAIVMFLVKMKVRKPAVVYMLNLAIADTLLVIILPFYIVYRFLGNDWIFGEGMCRFVTSAYYCNMYCSVLLMTSISVDRFLGVVYPVRSLPWRTVKRAWLVCGAIWVISLAITVPLLIREQTQKLYKLDNIICHDIQYIMFHLDFYFDYLITVISLFFFLPLFITTFCYIRIIRSLSRSQFDRTHKRSRAIRLSVIVLSVFVLCFGPSNVIYLMHYVQMYKSEDRSLYIPYIVSSGISTINCCLDPLIYYFASSEYKRYIYSFLHCKKDYRPPVK